MTKAIFDQLDQASDSQSLRSIYSIDLTKDAEVVKWAAETYDILVEERREDISRARENIALYKGVYPSVEPVIGGRDLPNRNRGRARLIVNHYKDLIEQKVTKVTAVNPATCVVPASTSIQDKLDSEVATEVLSSLKYDNDVKAVLVRAVRLAVLTGTAFVYQKFDRFKGALHPDWKKTKKEGKKVVLEDKDGEPILGADGKEIEILQPVYEGDIAYELRSIWDTFMFPGNSPDDCDGVILCDFVDCERLKLEYPNKKNDIRPDDKAYYVDPNSMVEKKLENSTTVFTVYVRSSRYMEEGCYFVCTRDTVLERPRKNPVSYIPRSEFGNIPVRWIRDIEIEGELYGYPSANDIRPLQNIYDKLITMMTKNVFWASHFRIFASQGSVDRADITNDSTIVWVRPGHQLPTGIPYQAFNADIFQLAKNVVEDMENIIGTSSVARGAPPPGTRSAASLYFYDEQDKQRSGNFQKKYISLILETDRLTLALVADNYEDHDKRLIRVLGDGRGWVVKNFTVDSLKKSDDVRIESTPQLPDSRYARIELLLQMKERAPGVITDEAFADAIDWGVTDKFMTPTRMARIAAQIENAAFMRGDEVPAPMKSDDHIVHWQEGMKQVQDPDYRNWPEENRKAIELHLATHERFMDEFAMESQAMAQQLMTIPQFPVFYTRPPMPVMPPMGAPEGSPPPGGPSGAPSPQPPAPGGMPGPGSELPPQLLGEQPPT